MLLLKLLPFGSWHSQQTLRQRYTSLGICARLVNGIKSTTSHQRDWRHMYYLQSDSVIMEFSGALGSCLS